MGYIYMFGCISPPVYDPLIIKWRMTSKGESPKKAVDQLAFSALGVVRRPLHPLRLCSRFRCWLILDGCLGEVQAVIRLPIHDAGVYFGARAQRLAFR